MTRPALKFAALFALTTLALSAVSPAWAGPADHARTLAGADRAVAHAQAAVARLQPRRPAPATLAGADRAVQQARAAVRRLAPAAQVARR